MTDKEIKARKKHQLARIISMATSLHFAIGDLMSMMIAEDDNDEFSLVDPEDEELYLMLSVNVDEIDRLANSASEYYKSMKEE